MNAMKGRPITHRLTRGDGKYLFGWLINSTGFLSVRGQVFSVLPEQVTAKGTK